MGKVESSSVQAGCLYYKDGNDYIRVEGIDGAILTALAERTVSVDGVYRLTSITSTWPSNDTFSFRPSALQNIRSFRFKAVKTAGATGGAVLKYAADADNEALAEQFLTSTPTDPNTQPYTYNDLEDGVWSEWVDISDDPVLAPLLRVDFLASADTWSVVMETR